MEAASRVRTTTEPDPGPSRADDGAPLTVLCVVNKRLPPGDYRFVHPRLSSRFRVIHALPERPGNLQESDFVRLAFGEGLRPAYIREFWRLYRYLASGRPRIDLVHFYSTNLVLLGPLIARLAGVPSVSTLTGFGRVFSGGRSPLRFLQGLYWLLFGLSLRHTRRLLLQNHADLQSLARRFPDQAHRLGYAGSTVSMARLQAKDFSDRPLVVILVARLMEDKGIDDFIAVARQFATEAIVFRLIGPASEGRSGILGRVHAAARDGLIDYLGELDPESTLEQLGRAHILFFPSCYGEGLSRVVLEAGFSRVYPIVYDIPSNRDLVRPGGGSRLAQRDVAGAVRVIRELDGDRRRLGIEAESFQRWIVENYDPAVFARRIDEFYEQALGR